MDRNSEYMTFQIIDLRAKFTLTPGLPRNWTAQLLHGRYTFPRQIIESGLRIRIISANYVEQECLTHGKFRLTVGVNDWSIKFSSQLVCCRPANDLMTGIRHLRVPLFLPYAILFSFTLPDPLLSAVLFPSFIGNAIRVKQHGQQTNNNVGN